jgi:hypothetical protein
MRLSVNARFFRIRLIGPSKIPSKALIASLIVASSCLAQISGGAFRGEVHDASNAVVQQARILIRSSDQGTQVRVESNGNGIYITPNLIPGTYFLSVEKEGFRTEVFGPVNLEVNQIVRVDFALTVGIQTESVQVEAAPTQLLASESAEISQVIGSEQVAEIPLNGRAWQQLIDLSAGVNPGAPGETGSPHPVNVSGQRTKANLYMADGLSVTSSAQGRTNGFNIPLEAIQEFSVQAGAYSAEFGNVAGGVINLQTKSGTNNWHGSLFEFFRNNAIDAANFFANSTGLPGSPLQYNQFGGSVGAPIRRNKTFFFADYQGTITHNSATEVTSVPVGAQRTGNFAGLTGVNGAPIPIYNPFGASVARTPFPNNAIPASLIDPAAASITALLPEPNQFGANGTPLPFNNYAATRASTANAPSFDIRIDHQFAPDDTVFARYSFQNTNAFAPSIFGLPLGGTLEGAGTTLARYQNAAIGHTYQLSPTLLNEIRIGLNRQTTSLTQEDYGKNLSAGFGIPGVNRSPQTSGLSTLDIVGLFSAGDSLLTPLQLATTDWNFSEKITWLKGRHAVRIGFDYQYGMGSTGYLVYGRGFYEFLNLTTSSAVGTPGGNAFASFLTGAPYQVLRDEFPPGLVGLLSYRYGFFVQDDIKITPRLTVNIGARYDVMPYPREMHDRLSNFNPATGTMLIAGQNTSQRLVNTDYKDLAPRIGVAWGLGQDDRTVVRAGYGIGYIDAYGSAGILNSDEFNVPFYYVNNITLFPYIAPTYTLSGGLPGLVMPSAAAPTGNQRYIVPTQGNQYSQTWSFGIQRALNMSSMVEVAYVGTSGNRLLTANGIDDALPGTTNPTARQPYGPLLGDIRELSNSAHSIYHGLQTKFERRFSRGLYFLSSYTWSKSIDDQSNGTDNAIASGQYPQDPLNPSLDRGLSSFNRPQVFVANSVWEIPLGRGWHQSGAAGVFRNIVYGWQLSGIFTAETGTPFSVLMNCADINAQGNNCRPNRIAGGALPSGRQSINEWFNTAAFVIPSTPAYGSAGRNILSGPGTMNLDCGLSRSIHLGNVETRRMQIRAEFFNALNHANFGLPQSSIDSPAFGTITTAAPARTIQLGARLEF